MMSRTMSRFCRFAMALPFFGVVLSATTVRADGASDHFAKAHAHYEKWQRTSKPEELDAALLELQTAHKARPKAASITQWIGFIELKQGKFEKALSAFQETIRLNPDSPDAYLDSGFAGARLGRYAEAEASYGQAISVIRAAALKHKTGRPQRSQLCHAYFDLGEVQFKQHLFSEALDAYRHAADLNTDQPKTLAPQELALYSDDRQQRTADEPKIQARIGVALVALGSSASISADSRYHDGLTLARLQRWVEAEEQFALAASANPKSPEIFEWLGYVRLQQKSAEKAQAAIEAFHTADSLRPGHAETHISSGRAYDALNRLDEAAAEFESAVKLDPSSSLAEYNLGSVCNRREKFAGAATAFKKALMLDPAGKAFDLALANAGLGYALHQMAATTGENERFDEAAMAQEKAVKINPALTQSWMDLATIYFDQAQNAEIKASAKQFESRSARDAAQVGEAWKRAAAALAQVVERAPETPKIRDVYAYALAKSDRGADAVRQFAKGVSLDEKPYAFLVTLADHLDTLKRYHEAEQAYRQALIAYAKKNQGENVTLIALLGGEQMAQGDYFDAENAYAKVIALTPEDLNAYILRYNALTKLGRKQEAVAVLKQGLTVSERTAPSDSKPKLTASLYRSLAFEYFHIGGVENLHRAAALYQASLKEMPDNAEAYNGLGAIALKRGQTKEALLYLNRAVALAPRSAEAYNNLGAVYESLDNVPLAVANYRKALTINQNNVQAKQNLSRYAALLKLHRTWLQSPLSAK